MDARIVSMVAGSITLSMLACGGDDDASGAQYGEKRYGELTTAEQKQLCVDVKKGFAPLEQQIQQVYCTGVGIKVSSGDDVTTCEARRDRCLDSAEHNKRDPACDQKDLGCDDNTRIDELLACIEAVKRRYDELSAKWTTCDPEFDDDELDKPEECLTLSVDVGCYGVIEQLLYWGEGVW